MHGAKKITINMDLDVAEELYKLAIENLKQVSNDFNNFGYSEIEWLLDRARATIDTLDALALAMVGDDDKE